MNQNDAGVSVLLGRSKIRQRILALLIDRPERRVHMRAVARAVGASAGTTARELARLVDAGLVERTTEGRQVYFRAADQSPLFDAVQTIVRRTLGAPAVVRRHLAGAKGVRRAFIYGSYARGQASATSDVDLMVIGQPDVDELTDRISAAEAELGRPVNYTILSDEEFAQRSGRGDRFVASIESGLTLPVVERDRA